jgi:transcriptional regulator with XRE-family HTH domain
MELGLLQREVGRFIGVDESTVWNWEKAGVKPAQAYLAKISEFLADGSVIRGW